MEWVLCLLFTILFSFIIYKWKFFHDEAIASKFFIAAFLLKVFCSWSQYWLFNRYHIGGDSISFFENGKYMFGLFKTNPLVFFKMITGTGIEPEMQQWYGNMVPWYNTDLFFNDNRSVIRVNALINFLSFGYYRVNAVFFAFLSMTGFTALFKLFSSFARAKAKMIFAVMFFIPSTVFWTAGISKEAWLIFLLGIFLWSLKNIYHHHSPLKNFAIITITIFLLLYIKVYFIIALFPAVIAFYVSEKLKSIQPIFIYFLVYILIFTALVNLPGFDFIKYVSRKQFDFVNLTKFVQSKSIIPVHRLENNITSFIINIPFATWNVLTRPYLWESKSVLWIFASIENCLLIILMIVAFLNFNFDKRNAAISFFCLFYSLSIFILIGLTTPIIGGLLRYKAPLLPFLLMFFIYHFNKEKLKSHISKVQ